MAAWILQEDQKMMKVPIFTHEWGKDGSWFPLYVRTMTTGSYAGEFPTVEETKKEAKRSLSFIDEGGNIDFWLVKMPRPGDAMPHVPELCHNYPLSDDWIINDRSALVMNVTYPLSCNFEQNEQSSTGGPTDGQQATADQQATEPPTVGKPATEDEGYNQGRCQQQSSIEISTPASDASIKDWVASKAFKTNMTLGEIDGLNVDDIYKIGYAAGLQAKQAQKDQRSSQQDQDAEANTQSLDSAASWQDAGEQYR